MTASLFVNPWLVFLLLLPIKRYIANFKHSSCDREASPEKKLSFGHCQNYPPFSTHFGQLFTFRYQFGQPLKSLKSFKINLGTNTVNHQYLQQISLNIWLGVTYKYANSEDSSYHKRGNSAIKEVCCSPRQFSKNIWCCSATGWGVSRTFRSKYIQLFKMTKHF